MLSILAYVVSAFFFFFVAINEQIQDWNMLGWGLFALAVGHVLEHFGHSDFGDRVNRRRDVL